MATTSRQLRIVAALVFSTIGLSSVLVMQGTGQLIASAYLPLDAVASTAGPTPRAAARPPAHVDELPILRRNMFDHETGRLDIIAAPEPEDLGEEEVVEELDPNAPPPACDGSMRLVGAFVRVRRPEDSFAAITNSTGEALLYQPGMSVDDREVVSIQHNLVILRRSGSLCSLTMFAEAPQVATAPVVRATPRTEALDSLSATQEGIDPAELEAGISQVSEREFSIDRGLVNKLLTNQAALMRTARVIPHEEGGRVVGVKLYGIRRSSLLGRLGIQNGDMLRTINGYDMSAPDSALEAYARLRNADRITINLTRRGADQTIDYQIR
ncbi:MAG: type II secretion system protein GspC [Sandaracinaceae bacterium]